MSFCPRCGAPRTPAMEFCVACGEMLPAVPTAPAGVAAAPTRPTGRRVAPWLAILLAIVTFGVYVFVFWWRTSRETDAATGSRSHGLARAGILVTIVALAVTFVGVVSVVMTFVPELVEDPATPIDQAELVAAYTANPIVWVGGLLSLAGAIVLYSGLWRMWSAIRADEIARAHTRPINPGLLLGLIVGVFAVQFVSTWFPVLQPLTWLGIGAGLYAMFATQDHLNAMWSAAAPAPLAQGA